MPALVAQSASSRPQWAHRLVGRRCGRTHEPCGAGSPGRARDCAGEPPPRRRRRPPVHPSPRGIGGSLWKTLLQEPHHHARSVRAVQRAGCLGVGSGRRLSVHRRLTDLCPADGARAPLGELVLFVVVLPGIRTMSLLRGHCSPPRRLAVTMSVMEPRDAGTRSRPRRRSIFIAFPNPARRCGAEDTGRVSFTCGIDGGLIDTR